MPTDQNPKQLVAQRLKDATNILVTVSRDPSVDELAAALATTLILDKMGKVATAVFSGKIPAAIEFLEPGKTFDANVDGLRDFIIALDKAKADRLRYKVEDDVVRVFITPYKTTISEKDLTFSQGDFNVDLVVAFGVEQREDLDAAIAAHGRILHDAGVITINTEGSGASLGEVDWNEPQASSLSEMLMSLTEALQSELLDEPIATAILTGLVSATDRFRNDKTSPKVMTMAAQLMAAGANQQLIAEKLEATRGLSGETEATGSESAAPKVPKKDDGEMKVEHQDDDEAKTPEKVADKDRVEAKAKEVAEEESADAIEKAEQELKHVTKTKPKIKPDPKAGHAKASSWRDMEVPATGGALSATAEQAEADKRKAEEDDKNHVILSHDDGRLEQTQPATPAVLNATTLESPEPTVPDIFATPPNSAPVEPTLTDSPAPVASPFMASSAGLPFEETPLAPAPLTTVSPTPLAPSANPTLADLEKEVNRQALQTSPPSSTSPTDPSASVDSARAAVDAAFGAQPFDPSGQPLAAAGAQPLGTVTHDDTAVAQPLPAAPASAPQDSPVAPALPPLPDFSTLPPLPGESPAPTTTLTPNFGLPEQMVDPQFPQTTPSTTSDPGQFKLPGQS